MLRTVRWDEKKRADGNRAGRTKSQIQRSRWPRHGLEREVIAKQCGRTHEKMKFTPVGSVLVSTPAFARLITQFLAKDKYVAYVLLAMSACADVPDAADDEVERFVRSHWQQLATIMSAITTGPHAKRRVRGKQRRKSTKQR